MKKGKYSHLYKWTLTSFRSWDDGSIKTMEQLVRERKENNIFITSVTAIQVGVLKTMQ
jgi:hypothetical protein